MRHMALSLIVVAVAGVCAPVYAEHDHEHHDIIIARTAGGQLAAEFHFDEETHLEEVSGLLNGWAGEAPGFGHLDADEPAEGFFMLEDGVQVYFEVVSFDPAFKSWAEGFSVVLQNPADSALLGGEHLHTHFEWHIDHDDPGFVHDQHEWAASFRLTDQGSTGYAPSETYTLVFTNEEHQHDDEMVPTVSQWGLIVLALALLAVGKLYFGRGAAVS